jgi:predicted nucleic acid-binding protein
MIVVADASPLRYLVAIGIVDLLKTLYGRVLVPEAVAAELQDAKTPALVRAFIAQPPAWLEIRPDPPFEPALRFLDAGERAAIGLAISADADGLLMDEWDGRAEAKRRSLVVTGTLGVLADAHLVGLFNFETALTQLRTTNFYVSDEVIASVRLRLSPTANK